MFLDSASASPEPTKPTIQQSESRDDFVELLAEAMAPLKSDNGWVDICVLGASLHKVRPGFMPSQYGKKKLKGLLQSCDAQAEIRTTPGTSLVRMRSREG